MSNDKKTKPHLGLRNPRRIKGYPPSIKKMIKRLKVGARKPEMWRQARPRRHAERRGTAYNENAALEKRAQQGIKGSLEERIFYKMLVAYNLIPDVDFDFQASEFGGRQELGGLVADFIFLVPKVVVQVQSYWHNISMELEIRDATQEEMLKSLGYLVLFIWSDTVQNQVLLDRWMTNNLTRLW